GFMKDHQTLIFLQIVDAGRFRAWLAPQVPFVATVSEVLAFNRLFKQIRFRRSVDNSAVKSTWMNIAFSYAGLKKLKDGGAAIARGSTDRVFADGPYRRAAGLGARTDPGHEGHPSRWVVGGTEETEADAVLIVASDDCADMYAEVARLERSLYTPQVVDGQ